MDEFNMAVIEVINEATRIVLEENGHIIREQAAARAAYAHTLAEPSLREEFVQAVVKSVMQQSEQRQAELQRQAEEDFRTKGASAIARSRQTFGGRP